MAVFYLSYKSDDREIASDFSNSSIALSYSPLASHAKAR